MSTGSTQQTSSTKLTVKQYAEREGVTPRTVWRWAEKGAVVVVRKGPRTGVRVLDDRQ